MEVSSPIDVNPALIGSKRSRAPGVDIPVIDLGMERSKLCELMVKACEEFGFFQVENHGVSREVICRVEREGQNFFSKPGIEKQKARAVPPTDPFGYGCKNIGFNGDEGELEYILLETNPQSISERSIFISTTNPKNFSCAVNDYIEGVRKLACEILDILGEGCGMEDADGIKLYSIFSDLIGDVNSDSCFRINHYPASSTSSTRIGFGEHSDPQIITLLRSNEIGGLQILSRDATSWITVPPEPDKFCVIVGDAFQALTNGRFVSVRHRAALENSIKSRMSIVYFAAPPLNASISPLPQFVSVQNPAKYRPNITWGDYKNTVYSLRLADNRLNFFSNQ